MPTETDADRRASFEVVQSAGLQATKYNNLIPYPGTPLWSELKDSGRVVRTENWNNFNSVLSITASVFDKTPLPYVPETCSEWQLKRDIIRYNIKSIVSWKIVAAVLGHTKGVAWFLLPRRWYFKPRELYEMAKIALHLAINIVMTSLPLRLSESIMIQTGMRRWTGTSWLLLVNGTFCVRRGSNEKPLENFQSRWVQASQQMLRRRKGLCITNSHYRYRLFRPANIMQWWAILVLNVGVRVVA